MESSFLIVHEVRWLTQTLTPFILTRQDLVVDENIIMEECLIGDNTLVSKESDADVQNNRDHGRRIDGSWVFVSDKALIVDIYFAQWRNRNTLIAIIKQQCETGSVIHSNEWPAYGNLKAVGYRHFTVNHQKIMWIQRQEQTCKSLSDHAWLSKHAF